MKVEIDIFGTTEDQSIDEAIVEAAAHELLQRREPRDPDAHGKDRPSTLEMRIMRRVREVQDEEIRAQVRPLVAEALVKPIQKTGSFGDPIGEPMMLRDHIIAEAQKLWTQTVQGGTGRARTSETVLQTMVREEVEKAFANELRQVIAEARGDVLEAVKATGAEVLTETLERAARGLS